MKMFQSNTYYCTSIKVYIVFIQEIWEQIYGYFWVHVYGSVGCIYAVVGCKVCGNVWVHVYAFWVHL